MTDQIVNISTYKFVPVYDTHALRQSFRDFCGGLGLQGTIIVSPEGINIALAGDEQQISLFGEFLHRDSRFADMTFKRSISDGIPFDRFVVKRKNHIVPAAVSVDVRDSEGTHLSAETLKKWLDEGRDFTLLDTRNDYEISHGTFDNACHFNLKNFKQIYAALKQCDQQMKRRPLVMFCTGGIRCEKGLPLAKKAGFEQVYQLDGGILKYLEECGGTHYRGKCYVFDQREALKADLKA